VSYDSNQTLSDHAGMTEQPIRLGRQHRNADNSHSRHNCRSIRELRSGENLVLEDEKLASRENWLIKRCDQTGHDKRWPLGNKL
jgi:hypothetical protein